MERWKIANRKTLKDGTHKAWLLSSWGNGKLIIVTSDGHATTRSLHKSRLHKGYLRVSLGSKGGEYLHRAVARLYIDNKPMGWETMDVDHADGNPANCNIMNLTYKTRADNVAAGYAARGSKPQRRGTIYALHTRTGELREHPTQVACARDLGASQGLLSTILNRPVAPLNEYKARVADHYKQWRLTYYNPTASGLWCVGGAHA